MTDNALGIDWSAIASTAVDEDLVAPDELSGDADFPDGEPVTLDAALVDEPKRSAKAELYEKKVRKVVRIAIKLTAPRPSTVPDAGILLASGPSLAVAWGDLAAEDARIAKMIDFLDDGADNLYLNALMVTIPVLAQILRNHEPVIEPEHGIKIPFTKKRIRIPFRVKFAWLNAITHKPSDAAAVMHIPAIKDKLAEQRIYVASPIDR